MGKTTSTLPQYQYKKKHGFFYNLKKYRVLTLMCVPAIVFFFAFNYMPLPGIYVAFVKYNYRDGIFGSKFVGLQNFEFLMQSGKLLDLTKWTVQTVSRRFAILFCQVFEAQSLSYFCSHLAVS